MLCQTLMILFLGPADQFIARMSTINEGKRRTMWIQREFSHGMRRCVNPAPRLVCDRQT